MQHDGSSIAIPWQSSPPPALRESGAGLYAPCLAQASGDGRVVFTEVSSADTADIDASLAGDEDAYARLVARYEGIISTQMWRFTRDALSHEELVQEVFVEAYLSLAGFRGRAPFEHWLRKIATRVGYRYWRRQSRERDRRTALQEWQRVAETPGPDRTPSMAAESLYRLLEQLPRKDRLILTLFYFEECDTREIAERMGWTRTLVKVRAHRARKKLRAMLEQEGISPFGTT